MTGERVLEQLQVLVRDLSLVISYKWLSRKFSLSSNAAKRLLQDFVDEHGSDLQVVYAVSGWTQSGFSVQLVQRAELQEAASLLVGRPSVHVYSVQSSLPKDVTQLWTSEYVQAKELFSTAADVSNCLHDNRFSAIACPLATRKFKGQAAAALDKPGDAGHASKPAQRTPETFPVQKAQAGTSGNTPEVLTDDDDDDDVAGFDRVRHGQSGREKRRIVIDEEEEEEENCTSNKSTKRKILRTRIDERGREVTEVVWDVEDNRTVVPKVAPDASKDAAPAPSKAAANPAPAPAPTDSEAAPAVKRGSANPASKSQKPSAKKAGKPAGKADRQQGSITSFFKKK